MTAKKKDSTVLNRRSFMVASAAGAAVAVSAGSAIAASSKASKLLGTSLGNGWSIAGAEAGFAGAVRVTATHATSGELHILVCKTEAGSKALASTGQVDLFLLNDGKEGAVLTADGDVDAVKTLASLLDGNENVLPGYSKLMGQGERLRNFDPIDHAEPIEGRI
jgi:hypothetical protein